MIGLSAVAHAWIAAVSGWSQAATGSLLAAVWQGVLLAVVAGIALRLVPRTPAAVRFAIWFAVFLLVTALPVMSLWPRAEGAGPAARGPWFTIDARWCLAIAAVWLVASVVRAGTLVAAALRVRALWKRATPVEISFGYAELPRQEDSPGLKPGVLCSDSPRAEARCYSGSGDSSNFRERTRCYSGTPRRAQICTSDEVDRPTVIGFFAPKILIPAWLLEKLTAAELEQIVLHEVGHLGRADDWMNLLQKIALVIFPLNPALAWVERRLCFERELAVDERVLRAFAGRAGAAKAYAACLATLAEYRLGRRAMALALGALGRGESELGRRVGRILRRGEGMKPLHTKLVLGGAMLGLLVAATGFERCPQVVGFTDGAAQSGARESRWQPTHGDEAAMIGAPGNLAGRNSGPARAFSVVYKTPAKNQIRTIPQIAHETIPQIAHETMPQIAHETLAVTQDATAGLAGETDATDKVQRPMMRRAEGAARMIQTMAPAAGTRSPRMISDSDGPPAQPELVMEWTVTRWQGGSETRMVLTTTGQANAVAGAVLPGSAIAADGQAAAAGSQAAGAQAGYAVAVPVRGGWIIFRL